MTSIVEYANDKPLNEILGISYKDSNGVIQHNPTATYPGATPEDASKILGTLLERGGNFVDIASFYTRGHPEKIIGDFIAQDGAASSEWFWPKALCSKFSVLNYSGRDRMQD